ncbi:hypothetical protein SSX86_031672, partial [Deinandra increscens subsp. villosa]
VVPPLLEAKGKLEVWSIDGGAKNPVAKEDIGKFYSGDCYIVLYSYHSREKKEDFYLVYWIGKDSTEEDQNTAAKLTASMFNSLKGRPIQGRVYQDKEPPQFIAIFQPMVVFKGGLSSSYKSYIAEKGLDDETYSPDTNSVVRILGTAVHNNKSMQLDPPGVPVKYQKEGSESASFWLGLGGKDDYTSNKVSLDTFRDPHLFGFSLCKEDILILDTRAEVIVWIGQAVDPKEKKNALEYGQKYLELAESLDGLSPHVPLYKVSEGNEPCFFTVYFSWESSKTLVPGNSFQKKITLLFGAGHAAGHGNQGGGNTQRASAMAALNSAFSGPGDGGKGPTKGPGGGGGSQRRAAVAALSGVIADVETPDSPEKPEEVPEENPEGPIEPSEPIPEDHDSEPKVEIEEDENGILSSQSTFTYEQVRVKSEDPAPGIDLKRRE